MEGDKTHSVLISIVCLKIRKTVLPLVTMKLSPVSTLFTLNSSYERWTGKRMAKSARSGASEFVLFTWQD